MRYLSLLSLCTLFFLLPGLLDAQVLPGSSGTLDSTAPSTEQSNLNGPHREPKSAEEYYDAGLYPEAAVRFLEKIKNKRKRVDAYYNAARSFHQDFIDNKSPDSLVAAVEGYYRVLDLNPGHYESLINLELARIELEKMQMESTAENNPDKEKQSDSPGESGKNGQNNDGGEGQAEEESLQEIADEQQKLADSPTDDANGQRQSALKERTEEARDQAEENSALRDALDEAVQKQDQALDQMSQGNSREANQAQQEAASLLQEALQGALESEETEGAEDDNERESLPENIQSILNQEQSRNQDKFNEDDMIRVEKNW